MMKQRERNTRRPYELASSHHEPRLVDEGEDGRGNLLFQGRLPIEPREEGMAFYLCALNQSSPSIETSRISLTFSKLGLFE